MKIKYLIFDLSLLFIILVVQSCAKKEDVKLDSPQLIMYTPIADVEGLSMKLVWTTLPDAKYIVEVSYDNFSNVIDTLVFNKDTSSVTVSDLSSNVFLYARIKALSKDGSTQYADYKNSSIFLQENVFTNHISGVVNSSDISSNSIKLVWQSNRHVTSIIKICGDVNDTIQLSNSELLAQNKTFNGLLANTKYKFKIMKNQIVRGIVSASTKSN